MAAEAGEAPRPEGADAPDFDRLIGLQGASRRRYGLAAGLLAAAGLGVAACGAALGSAALAGPGLLAAALAALPWREALERRDRAQGLAVLAEEWAELGPGGARERERLLALVEAMFGRARPGPSDGAA